MNCLIGLLCYIIIGCAISSAIQFFNVFDVDEDDLDTQSFIVGVFWIVILPIIMLSAGIYITYKGIDYLLKKLVYENIDKFY